MITIHCYQRDKDVKRASKKLLHQKLIQYLNIDDKKLTIQTNENGKPSIAGIYFSVSHCQNLIVQGFTQEGELGIDIEFKNPKRNYKGLAQRYFHVQEFQYLSSLNNVQALSLFYNLWTTKEAICKAQGGRLWYYLAENCLNKSNNIKSTIKGLHIVQLDHFSDYSLSLATQTKPKNMEIIDE
jgi:phosphopantetheinyl transferase